MAAGKSNFFRNIALVLLPILLYYILFIAFEPNNYFGLKAQADGTDIMAVLRQYKSHPTNRVILGDSRMAKISDETALEQSGQAYANLAFGGAALKEQLDILDWVEKQNPDLEQVVFMVSFYTLPKTYNQDRMIIHALNNPFVYMTNLGYNINMLTNLYDHLSPKRQVGATGESRPLDGPQIPYQTPAGDTVMLPQPLAEHLVNMASRTGEWAVNDKQLQRLLDTIADFEEKGIEFVLVLPPAAPEVMSYIIQADHIYNDMQPVLKALHQSGARVLDYEFVGQGLFDTDQFYDGLHLDAQRGLPYWTHMLFEDLTGGGKA